MLDIAVIYLAAALVAVPIAKRLNLGSVLGYLLAGVLIGPFILGWVGDQTQIMHVAEYGVVMMLFLVGLELHPHRLWRLRHSILGLGGLQVLLTAGLIMLVCLFAFELSWQAGLSIGLMLALSSTAIILQTLSEKGWSQWEAGKNAFSVLLFQDIAVIPILALLPLLTLTDASHVSQSHDNIIAHYSVWVQVMISVAVIISIIMAGKYISPILFRYIAETRLREIFTIFALFLVIFIAFVMQKIGLSPALGTFLAGVVLAESEFRHELEVDIEPFKGLLLGLFFITVGASINFPLLLQQFTWVMLSVVALIVIKVFVLMVLAKLFKMQNIQQLLFAILLAQGGEFAFVIVTLSTDLQILTQQQSQFVTVVVTISMLLTPIILLIYDYVIGKRKNDQLPYDAIDTIEPTKNVIIAGYGRFGQIIGRLLTAQDYHLSILDHSPSQIDLLRAFGNKVFYGDASRLDSLAAAGAAKAQLLVIAVNDADKILEIAELAQKHYPNLKIAARATDRRHAYQLIKLGVDAFQRDTFGSAVSLGVRTLTLLGNDYENANRAGQLFSQHDEESLYQLANLWGDDKNYGLAVRQRLDDLKHVLQRDQNQRDKLHTCNEKDGTDDGE